MSSFAYFAVFAISLAVMPAGVGGGRCLAGGPESGGARVPLLSDEEAWKRLPAVLSAAGNPCRRAREPWSVSCPGRPRLCSISTGSSVRAARWGRCSEERCGGSPLGPTIVVRSPSLGRARGLVPLRRSHPARRARGVPHSTRPEYSRPLEVRSSRVVNIGGFAIDFFFDHLAA
jgi:hypothetical protein